MNVSIGVGSTVCAAIVKFEGSEISTFEPSVFAANKVEN